VIAPPPEGWFTFDDIPFPEVEWLTAAERKILRRVLKKHPEYLLEIPYGHKERIQ